MKGNKMRNTILALATAVAISPLAAMPAAASDRTDVVAMVKQYAEAFNKADKDGFQGLCAPQAAIIDDVPPHVFQGSAACTEWWDALHALDKQEGINAERLAIGKLKRVAVTGDRAYVVTPVIFSYNLKGKATSENGIWTLALQKLTSGWRITGWTWSQMSQEAPHLDK
jgi:ketosteroid isomerase-like protein